MNVRLLASLLALVISLTSVAECLAVLIGYTDRSAFDAAASGGTSVVDFDSEATGTVASGSAVGGLTFTYDFGGVNITIEDEFDTTSAPNYLGTDDGGVLADGDDIDFSFSAVTGFGLYIVTADELFDDDLELTAAGETVGVVATEIEQTLADGSDVYFLGIQSDDNTTFTSASLTTIGGGFFFYTIDDIVTSQFTAIPEASTLLIWTTLGVIGYVKTCRHRRN